MSFTESDFVKLKKANGIKKGAFALKEYLNDKKSFEYAKEIVDYIDKYYGYDFVMTKNRAVCEEIYDALLQELFKLNPYLEKNPFDNEQTYIETLPIKVLLDNIRSPFNVGSIVRTASALGVDELLFCGETLGVENNKVKRVSMGASIRHKRIEKVIDALIDYKKQGHCIIALEKTNNSTAINEIDKNFPMILVVGNEEFGVDIDILKVVDKIVHINMRGTKNSLNVSVATGIALHTILSVTSF